MNNQAVSLISEFEGCKLKAYKDIVGVWTIGWGSTDGVSAGQTITQVEADTRRDAVISRLEQEIRVLVRAPLNDNQLGALISFSYNLGIGSLKSSTLLKRINQGDLKSAADEFLKWSYAGGKTVIGLVRRRKAERQLFLTV